MLSKYKNIILFFVAVIYLAVITGFISESRKEIPCSGLNVQIADAETNKFIQNDDVAKLFEKNQFKYLGLYVEEIDVSLAEKLLYKFPSVKQAEAFISLDGKLNVSIQQRTPLIRVINGRGESYYIDREGGIMPWSDEFTAFVLIANGFIFEPYATLRTKSVFIKDSIGTLKRNVLNDLYDLALFIDDNEFWKSQMAQIFVKKNGEIELIPRVGAHTIEFGNIDEMDLKFRKIRSVYKAFNTMGWNVYKKINVKYKNQIVCTKR